MQPSEMQHLNVQIPGKEQVHYALAISQQDETVEASTKARKDSARSPFDGANTHRQSNSFSERQDQEPRAGIPYFYNAPTDTHQRPYHVLWQGNTYEIYGPGDALGFIPSQLNPFSERQQRRPHKDSISHIYGPLEAHGFSPPQLISFSEREPELWKGGIFQVYEPPDAHGSVPRSLSPSGKYQPPREFSEPAHHRSLWEKVKQCLNITKRKHHKTQVKRRVRHPTQGCEDDEKLLCATPDILVDENVWDEY